MNEEFEFNPEDIEFGEFDESDIDQFDEFKFTRQ